MRLSSLFLFSLLLLVACSPSPSRKDSCSSFLYDEDQKLYESFGAIQQRRYELGLSAYIGELRRLDSLESSLYEQAKACEFKDPQAYNYWHRGRMKFPSRIAMELNQYE